MTLFSFVKSQLSILDVVSEYATLKKAGLYWKGHCPFHHEKTASFTVSPHKEIFYCFGCQAGGDVISFIAKVENCSPLQAAQHLVDRYKLTLPEGITHELQNITPEERNRYYDLCKFFASWCHENLLKSSPALNYFLKRDFTKSSLEYFSIGYFPGGLATIKQLINRMATHNLLSQDLIEAHILSEGKTVLYSPFEERLIFPIKDHLGRFCGFGGRIFKANDERPKYYNSRENEYFSKGSLLFGLDAAKKSIQETEIAFLVEGYTDCMAMVQSGLRNTVATLGTACTVEHLKTLARHAQHLYVVFDGDNAGHQAILRVAEMCWQVSLELKVISLPNKEDPASYLSKGNKLDPLIAQAQDIFLFFIDTLGNKFATKPLSEKITQIRKLIGIISNIDDPLKRDILLARAAKILDVPLPAMHEEIEKALDRQKAPLPTYDEEKVARKADSNTASSQKLEKKIFCAIMNNVELFNNSNEKYLLEFLQPPLRDILKKLKEIKEEYMHVDFIQFFAKLNENEKHYVSKLLLEYEEDAKLQTFEQLLIQLHKKNWKVIVNDIKDKVARAKNEGDTVTVAKILQDFLELKQTMLKKEII